MIIDVLPIESTLRVPTCRGTIACAHLRAAVSRQGMRLVRGSYNGHGRWGARLRERTVAKERRDDLERGGGERKVDGCCGEKTDCSRKIAAVSGSNPREVRGWGRGRRGGRGKRVTESVGALAATSRLRGRGGKERLTSPCRMIAGPTA